MKIYTLRREQFFALPREQVFRFFESPENLERITPSDVGFVILTPRPIEMKAGTILDYTIRIFGVPLHWRTFIESYDPPTRFVDVSLKGPYTLWHHTHTFVEKDGGTVMIDEVRYALPFGWIGRLVHALSVKRQLRHIFDFRARVINQLLDAESEADGHISGAAVTGTQLP